MYPDLSDSEILHSLKCSVLESIITDRLNGREHGRPETRRHVVRAKHSDAGKLIGKPTYQTTLGKP